MMRDGYWKLGQWKKVPVFFHWTIFLWIPWYLYKFGDLLDTVLTFAAFVALLMVHEMGHAIAAKLNRIPVHAIKLYLLHGQCEHQEAHYEAEDLLIAWGGVLAQLVVLVLVLAAKFVLTLSTPEAAYFLTPLFYVFINANALMILINLIPIAPLDGSKAWRVIPYFRPRFVAWAGRSVRSLKRALNLKERKAAKKASEKAASDLLDRLTKKKD